MISYGIAAGVTEGEKIPMIKKALEETKDHFKKLSTMLHQAQTEIDDAKKHIKDEIHNIGDIASQIETTETFAVVWATIDQNMYQPLKDSAEELIKLCNQYVKSKNEKKEEKAKEDAAATNEEKKE